MDVLSAEQDLETKLQADITGIEITAYPDEPETLNAMGFNGAILIRYSGSIYSEMDLEAVRGKVASQTRTVEWVITILYQNLNAHTDNDSGVYTYIEDIRSSLTGYTIDSLAEAGVMYPVRDGFVSRNSEKMLWEYEIVFRHTIPETEDWQ